MVVVRLVSLLGSVVVRVWGRHCRVVHAQVVQGWGVGGTLGRSGTTGRHLGSST